MSSHHTDKHPVEKGADAAEKTAEEKGRPKWLIDFLKLFPVIGDPVAWTYEHWELSHLLFFILGAVLIIILVFFGLAPNFIVSQKYKGDSQPFSQPTKPQSIEVTSVTAPESEWLSLYKNWFEEIIENEKKDSAPSVNFGSGVVESQKLDPAAKFRWVLRENPGFSIDGRAFLLKSNDLIKPLTKVREQNSISFEVPECDEGDRLVAVISARWQGNLSTVEIESTFTSWVK